MRTLSAAQRRSRDLRKYEKTHFALRDQFAHRADALFDRDSWVNAVQLIEVDHLDTQTTQARLTSLMNMSRAAIKAYGFSVLVPDESTLGGKNDFPPPLGDSSPHELFIVPGSIHVCGVKKVDAEVPRSIDRGQRL